jgi:P27 family predicted phage terminase small subunit
LLPGGGDEAVRASAARTWAVLAARLTTTGLAADVDVPMVVDYSITVARIEQLERTVSTDGPVVSGRDGNLIRHPALAALSAYRGHARALGDRLGIGAGARANLRVPEAPTTSGGVW